jgi:hypothetical protein
MIVIFHAFTAATVSKIFSGYQPCQLVKNNRRSWDRLYPYYQEVMSGAQMVPETSVTFSQLTWPISPINGKLERVCSGISQEITLAFV